MTNTNRKNDLLIWYGITIILAGFSFYYGLGSYPLLDNNEGLYASIAKYMVLNKDWIIPHLNCLPYLEKPPLLYWLLAGSMQLFGFTAFAARFITASSAFLLCLIMLFFGRKIHRSKESLCATLIFATSVGVILIARMVFFDMLLTLLLSISLFSLYYWQQTTSKLALRLAYLALAFGILTKGLVALALVVGTLVIYLLIEKQLAKIKKLFDLPGILIFLAVVLPWHLAAAMQHSGFTTYYLINEQLLRFFSMRVPHDYYEGPWYYYLPRIMVYLAPWSLLFPLFLINWKNNFDSALKRFLWCWVIIPLLFFSASRAKANYYMIVSMPALAYLLGAKLLFLYNRNRATLVNVWLIVICLLFGSALAFALSCFKASLFVLALRPQILVLSVFIVTITIFTFRYRKIALEPLLLFATIIIPIATLAIDGVKLLQQQISAENVGRFIQQHQVTAEFYLYQDFEKYSAIAFYSGQCFKMVDSRSNDLYYAQTLPQTNSWFLTAPQLAAIVVSQSPAKNTIIKSEQYIIIPKEKLRSFSKSYQSNSFTNVYSSDNLSIMKLHSKK